MTKVALCGAFFSVVSLSAQDPVTLKEKQDKLVAEAKALSELTVMGAAMISGPTVKGAPYSAEVVNQMVQVLADGNRITHTNSSMVYRDSQGRERREEMANGTVRSIFITDPVEGVSYTLHPSTKEARKGPQREVHISTDAGAVGVTTTETRTFLVNSSGNGPETFFFNTEVNSSKAKPVVEHLGTQTIEGVSAEGIRTTVTIPAGQIGNELPIVTVNERWSSPELRVTVMSTRSDPRTGTTTYKLTNVSRAEPSPALFQVPPDYTMHDAASASKGYVIKPDDN